MNMQRTMRKHPFPAKWRRLLARLAGFAGSCALVAAVSAEQTHENSGWAFRPPVRPNIPEVHNSAWVRTPVDAFILARLEQQGSHPAAEADRRTLLRRVTFDLTGLPPTPEEVDAFLRDTDPDAYEKVVERLLADPRYGERWAQHWLDVVRYADSNGFEYDDPRPYAWRYRDWVISSFNEDKPYDQFVREQVAGDQLFPGDVHALVATGFHRLAPLRLNAGNQDEEKNRQEVLTEMTDAIGATFLGITVGCARCHDHKFDPIPQADYYRLQAFFAPTFSKDFPLVQPHERQAFEQTMQQWQARAAVIQEKLAELEEPSRTQLTEAKKARLPADYQHALTIPEAQRNDEQKRRAQQAAEALKITQPEVDLLLSPADRKAQQSLLSQLAEIERAKPALLPMVMAVMDADGVAPATYVLRRGELRQPLAEVQAAFPATMETSHAPPAPQVLQQAGGRRSELAHWLTSEDHPLTARVMVNRIWQHHFGRGLVATANDFGLMGQPPTHPELLDWLACELRDRGWSMKAIHRLMVLSAAYRQSSQPGEEAKSADPANDLCSHVSRRRLDAEQLRDSVLAVSGTLNAKQGGPGVLIPLTKEVTSLIYKGTWEPTPDAAEHARRSIYLFVKRNVRPPLLEVFDVPSTMVSCPKRHVSTHAGQALTMLNSEFLDQQAWAFARRLLREADLPATTNGAGPSKPRLAENVVRRAYQSALARVPSPQEQELALRFLQEQTAALGQQTNGDSSVPLELPSGIDPAFAAALADFCLVMFNLDEFVFLE